MVQIGEFQNLNLKYQRWHAVEVNLEQRYEPYVLCYLHITSSATLVAFDAKAAYKMASKINPLTLSIANVLSSS